jgi:hypothetical protein
MTQRNKINPKIVPNIKFNILVSLKSKYMIKPVYQDKLSIKIVGAHDVA